MIMEEENVIKVEFKDEKTGKIMGKKEIRNNIFIDATKKYSKVRFRYLKFLEWIVNKIIRHADHNIENRVRFKRVHKWVKRKLVYRGLHICERVIGKHLIRTVEDIPAEPHNNHQRMFMDSWLKAVDDIWRLHIWKQGTLKPEPDRANHFKHWPKPQDMVDWYHKTNQPSHHLRVLLGQLYLTEVMEDTVDRTMSDCFMMRVTHTMMEHYGVKPDERAKVPVQGEYPIYLSDKEKNKPYFISFSQVPIWYAKDSKETHITDLERENHELKEQVKKLSVSATSKKKQEVKKDES